MKCKKAATIVAGLVMAMSAATPALADSGAEAKAVAAGSAGFLSGNVIQVPLHIPINVCGDSINFLALLNHTSGNTCIND